MTSRIQYRAICPICFNEQAVKGDRLVDHGYTIPQDWHQRNGSCTGFRAYHFGTEQGRLIAREEISKLNAYIEDKLTLLATDVGTITVTKRHFIRGITTHTYTKDDGADFTRALERRNAEIRAHIGAAKAQIKFIRAQLKGWKVTTAREVPVEVKVPTVHGDGNYYDKHAAYCAASAMGAQRSLQSCTEITGNWGRVTCARCLKQKAAADARKAA
jgi:hypothetical protein